MTLSKHQELFRNQSIIDNGLSPIISECSLLGVDCVVYVLFGTHPLHVRCFWLRWTEPHSVLFICQPARPSLKNPSQTKSRSHFILSTAVDTASLSNLGCNQSKLCGCDKPLGYMSSPQWKVNGIDCVHTKEPPLISTSLSTGKNLPASLRSEAHGFIFLLAREVSTGCHTGVCRSVERGTCCVVLALRLSETMQFTSSRRTFWQYVQNPLQVS
jgi:hypothetical protein